jgi:uncharacterized membrane protein
MYGSYIFHLKFLNVTDSEIYFLRQIEQKASTFIQQNHGFYQAFILAQLTYTIMKRGL